MVGLASLFLGLAVQASPLDFSSCRARIPQIVCLVDKANGEAETFDRPCRPGGEKYVAAFEGHFDRAPEILQKMYCHLDRLFVESDFVGTAFAALHVVDGKTVGGGIGIRREVLDQRIDLDRWLSWKEEVTFGGSTQSGDPLLGIFRYQSTFPTHEFFLDYILAHEMGHLFDFANGVNAFEDCRDEETPDGGWRQVGACTPKSGTFSELSWERIDRARGADEYPLRDKQCSYFCNGHYLPRDLSAEMFRQLMGTSFVSPYASRYAGEDWAETFAVSLMSWDRGFRWAVAADGVGFDLSAHFESDLLGAKREYVRTFLAKPLLYPGNAVSSADPSKRRGFSDF